MSFMRDLTSLRLFFLKYSYVAVSSFLTPSDEVSFMSTGDEEGGVWINAGTFRRRVPVTISLNGLSEVMLQASASYLAPSSTFPSYRTLDYRCDPRNVVGAASSEEFCPTLLEEAEDDELRVCYF